jgi:ATP-dependent RNA helicase DDX47/RRP3
MPEELKFSLNEPAFVSLNARNKVDENVMQFMTIAPSKRKATLVYFLQEMQSKTVIVFVSSIKSAVIIHQTLRELKMDAVLSHGELMQRERTRVIEEFRKGMHPILVSTNVATRGIDIPIVDVVINYELPGRVEEYIHRVGRCGRFERAGMSLTIICSSDLIEFQKLEKFLKKKLELQNIDENKVNSIANEVEQARVIAADSYKDARKEKTKRLKAKRKQ